MGETTEYSRCPEIDVSLNGKLITTLIDTSICHSYIRKIL